MTGDPVSGLPDPKYAAVTCDTIRGLDERLERKYVPVSDLSGDGVGVDPDCAEAVATLRVLRADLRTALAQLDEARAALDCERRVSAKRGELRQEERGLRLAAEDRLAAAYRVKTEMNDLANEERHLRLAAEARLEELTRELDEAKALVAANWCGSYWRGVNHNQADEVRAFLHQGGSDAR